MGPGHGRQRAGRDLGRRREIRSAHHHRARAEQTAEPDLCSNPKVFFRYANGVRAGASAQKEAQARASAASSTARRAPSPSTAASVTPIRRSSPWRSLKGVNAKVSHVENWIDCIKSRAAQRRHRDRPSLGDRLPPGQHRPLDQPQAALGPGRGDLPRRSRRQSISRPPPPQALRAAGGRVRESAGE